MELVTTEIKTPKEATELGLALGKIALAVKDALKDGIGADDLPKVIAAVMSSEVAAGLQGIDKIGEELKGDKVAFAAAFLVAGLKIAEEL